MILLHRFWIFIVSYSHFQSVTDLRRTAIWLALKFDNRPVGPLLDRLKVSDNALIGNWQLALSAHEFKKCVEWSCLPKEGFYRFLFSTCIRLIDLSEGNKRGGDFEWEWHAFAEDYRKSPPAIRSAIMVAFSRSRRSQTAHESVLPSQEDVHSEGEEQIVHSLQDMARRMTNEDMRSIAGADYGCSVERHYRALKDLLATRDLRFPKGDVWYPQEVVELTSHCPGAIGFLPCTALVLLNAVYGDDVREDAAFLWNSRRKDYRQLPIEEWKTISSTFRYIYQTDEDWDPLFGSTKFGSLREKDLLPWFAPSNTTGISEGITAQS